MNSTAHKLATSRLVLPEQRAEDPRLDWESVYTDWFHEVRRWVRAFGVLEPDSHDLAQEVFLVVRRKLPDFDGQNLKGWLYCIARRTVRDYRRTVWFRRLFARKDSPHAERTLKLLVEPAKGPAERLESREAERTLAMILKRMRDEHRVAFILFEVEGYTGEEIAALEGVPTNTIWTRLRRARQQAERIVLQLRREGKLE